MKRLALPLTSALLAAAATAAVFAALSGAAAGVKPESGEWRYDGSPQPVIETFTVTAGDSPRIRNFRHSGIDCTYRVAKAIQIKQNGSFRYKGGAALLGGEVISVTIAGRFVSRKKAKYAMDPETDACGSLSPEVVAEPVSE